MTVRQLTEVAHLRTRLVAGATGDDRLVLWAHTCELPEPWQWLGTGDLLLTDGYSLPEGEPQQVEFIRQLFGANLSGVVLAEGMHAPPLTVEAVAEADALGFPILETAYAVPFVSVVRTVAEANSQDLGRRLQRILRVYDVLRRASSDDTPQRHLLARLAEETGTRLEVIDPDTGREVLPADEPMSGVRRAAVMDALKDKQRPLPAFTRVSVEGTTSLVLPLEEERAVLVGSSRSPESPIDLVVLQHVATIAGIEVERRTAATLRRRVAGARLLTQVLEGTIEATDATARLAAVGLGVAPWRMVSLGTLDELAVDAVQAVLTQHRCAHLLLAGECSTIILMSDGCASQELLTDLCAVVPCGSVGSSRPIHATGRIPDGEREAQWAFEASRSGSHGAVVYGDEVPQFLPATVAEGEAVIDRILGPVIRYDLKNDSALMLTLGTYFDTNRSGQRSAAVLGIHKQTMVYRIGRIEKLLDRSFQDLNDLAEVYLAYRTWKLLDVSRDRGPKRS